MFKLSFTSYFDQVKREVERAEMRQRAKAARHVAKKLRESSKDKFGSGSKITEGIGYINEKVESRIGVGPPAYHAHLQEFGTDSRFTKKGKGTGHIKPNPFIFPVFDAEAGAVIDILQEGWF